MDLTLLRQLIAAHGVSGDEGEIRALIARTAAPYADEMETDPVGNLILHKKGPGPRVMFAAHMDTVGLVVTHIEPDGYLRVSKIGGLVPADLSRQRMRFANGTHAVVAVSETQEEKKFALSDLVLDLGAADEKAARDLVQVGDTCAFDAPVDTIAGGRILAPYLDNRVGCYVLLRALEMVKNAANDVYLVFTVQEEVGLRGAKPAAFGLAPDYGIAVDVTCTDDQPGSDRSATARLGKGAAIKVMDHSVICHPAFVGRLEQLAGERGIAHQRDLLRTGGTDAGALIASGSGVVTGGISVPCRYTHTPGELCAEEDIDACVQLVAAVMESELPKV